MLGGSWLGFNSGLGPISLSPPADAAILLFSVPCFLSSRLLFDSFLPRLSFNTSAVLAALGYRWVQSRSSDGLLNVFNDHGILP